MSATCRMEDTIPTDQRQWHWFLLVSAMIFGSGLVLIIIGRILLYFFHDAKRRNNSVVDLNDVSIHLFFFDYPIRPFPVP